MKKLWVIVFLIVSGYIFSAGFLLSGVGSEAISLGGAFRAQADDYSAAYWNPAGLVQIQNPEFTLLGGPIYNYATLTLNNVTVSDTDPVHGYWTGKIMAKNKIAFIPNLGGFYPLKSGKNMIFGIAMYVPIGMGSFWDLYHLPDGYNDNVKFPEIDTISDLKVFDVHPTFSMKVNDNLSFGFGVGYQIASVELNKVMLSPTGQTEPVNYIATSANFKGNGSGISYNAGLLYALNGQFRFALTYNGGTKITLKGDSTLDSYIPTAFRNANPTTYSSDIMSATGSFETSLPVPGIIGFGTSYKINETMTLNLDFAYTLWSVYKNLDITFGTNDTDPLGQPMEEVVQPKNWKDTYRLSLGFQKMFGEKLVLDLGYYMETSPIPDETFEPMIPDTGLKNVANLGLGYKFTDKMKLWLNVENTFSPQRDVKTSADVNGDGVYDNVAGVYNLNIISGNISISYAF